MIRRAQARDVGQISQIYDELHTEEEAGRAVIGWIRGVYPTQKTAEDAICLGHMFVAEENGRIVAAAKLNQIQEPAYALVSWHYDAPAEQVMVLHTLVVSPRAGSRGYGTKFVSFYEQYALAHGCRYLRMDTNAKNLRARTLYKRLGYMEAGIVPTVFNGIQGVRLVCLEKRLKGEE